MRYGIVVQDIRRSVARIAGAGYWECGYANKLTWPCRNCHASLQQHSNSSFRSYCRRRKVGCFVVVGSNRLQQTSISLGGTEPPNLKSQPRVGLWARCGGNMWVANEAGRAFMGWLWVMDVTRSGWTALETMLSIVNLVFMRNESVTWSDLRLEAT
jgi:hypothetical protein